MISSSVHHGCALEPMDWTLDCTVHRGYLGLTVGEEIFTDISFADDVSLLASMLEILTVGISDEGYSQLGLGIS